MKMITIKISTDSIATILFALIYLKNNEQENDDLIESCRAANEEIMNNLKGEIV